MKTTILHQTIMFVHNNKYSSHMSSESYIVHYMLCNLPRCSMFIAYRCRRNNTHHEFEQPEPPMWYDDGWWRHARQQAWDLGLDLQSANCHPYMPLIASKAVLGLLRLNCSSRLHMSLIVNHAIVSLVFFLVSTVSLQYKVTRLFLSWYIIRLF